MTKTTFAEEQQTRKLLGGERLTGKSICLSVHLPPSLTRQASMAQPLFLVLVCVCRFSSNLGSIDSRQKQMPVTIFSCMFI